MAVADETTLADRIRAVCDVFGLGADELARLGDSLEHGAEAADTLLVAPRCERVERPGRPWCPGRAG
jgi:hypothetical protein